MKLSMSRLALAAGLAALVIVAAVAGYFTFRIPEPAVTGSGVPSIGGPFTLVDQNGRTVTDKDFQGRHMLIYFGFTYCPDVCPTTLTTMTDALRALGPDGEKVVPILISVDPGRDTPEQLKAYVPYFHPRLLGLTGTAEQVAAVAKEYRVYYAKVGEKGAAPAPEDDSYTMDHTSIVYLMGTDGQYVTHFSHGTDADEMARRIKELL